MTVSQKKWDKIKFILKSIRDLFKDSADRPEIDRKDLERKVGFLVHAAMAYPLMFPFLKGFYLTMNSWREGRDTEDWKLPPAAYREFIKASRRQP